MINNYRFFFIMRNLIHGKQIKILEI